MAVGLGCFFILSVRAVQANLLREFDAQLGESTPDLIVIDIQADQTEGVAALAAPFAQGAPQLVPLMRGRVVSVKGRRLTLTDAEAVREHRQLAREYGLTYRSVLEPNERITAGRFWTERLSSDRADDDADTEVSIERELGQEAGLEVGDLVRFNIAGHLLAARVTSIREVAWDDAQNGGFVFILRPGPAADKTPHSFVGFLRTADDAASRGTLQRDLVRAYPNVSIIDVRDILRSVREVLDNVTLAITIVGAVTLASGVLILIGAVAMTKFQRLYEAAIYRTLGASTRLLATLVAVEYGTLGLLAGLLGATGAFGLSWALARFLFEIPWSPAPVFLGAGALGTGLVVAVVGIGASLDVLVRKPLGTLRSE
jgi:putative ABC transport system permease protein